MAEETKEISKYSKDKKQIFTLPNILTYIRILCVPVILVLFLKDYTMQDNALRYAILGLFLFASITDVVDGRIARRFNLVSDIGKALDPLADKLLQVSVIVFLSISGRLHWIFAILIFVKELYMVVGGILLVKRNIIGHANVWGKIAAFLLAVGIIFAFFEGTVFMILTYTVMSGGVFFTYYAAYNYTVFSIQAYKKYLKQGDEERIYIDYKKD
ncbi:MAG: CDP-alcohol phosphatidyltransferase family protein [Christensenellales bacterium]|jgi:cardiolipin synthase